MDIPETFEGYLDLHSVYSQNLLNYLKEHNVSAESILGPDKTIKYNERAIYEDVEVYIQGNAMSSGNHSAIQHENITLGKKGIWGIYCISCNSEKTLLKGTTAFIAFAFITGLFLVILGIVLFILL